MSPLPVTPGDTVTFRAVTSRQVVVYSWSLSSGEQIGPARDSILWRAPDTAGVYTHTALRGRTDPVARVA